MVSGLIAQGFNPVQEKLLAKECRFNMDINQAVNRDSDEETHGLV